MKKNKLWFRRKTYGWGWTPITWEGWTASALCVIIPFIIRFSLKALAFERGTQYFYAWASVPILIMGLTLICFRFGEKPKWQWGVKRTKLANIALKACKYAESVRFYDLILLSLGMDKLVSRNEYTTYTDGTLKIILTANESGTDLSKNHLAFYAETKEYVDDFFREVITKNNLPLVDNKAPHGDKNYYSVSFSDPNGHIIELLYSPFYCEKEYSLNNVESTFNPY